MASSSKAAVPALASSSKAAEEDKPCSTQTPAPSTGANVALDVTEIFRETLSHSQKYGHQHFFEVPAKIICCVAFLNS